MRSKESGTLYRLHRKHTVYCRVTVVYGCTHGPQGKSIVVYTVPRGGEGVTQQNSCQLSELCTELQLYGYTLCKAVKRNDSFFFKTLNGYVQYQ